MDHICITKERYFIGLIVITLGKSTNFITFTFWLPNLVILAKYNDPRVIIIDYFQID